MTQAQINYMAYFVEKIEEATGSEKKALELKLKLYCQNKGFEYPIQPVSQSEINSRAGPQIKAIRDPEKKRRVDAVKVSSTDANCENCGKLFERKRKDAKFCSSACRLQNHRKINL